MNTMLDQHAVNHATVALRQEMTPRQGLRHRELDTLFLGGPSTTEADRTSLGKFGFDKNYKLVVASFDPAEEVTAPTGYDVVVTDGQTQWIALSGGRLWKRDRRTPAILIFAISATTLATVKISAKGRMLIGDGRGRFADEGFERARMSVAARTAAKPGTTPVVSPMGSSSVVLDCAAFVDMLEAE